MNLKEIQWPPSRDEAIRHYLGFVLKVVEHYGFRFPETAPNPIPLARGYIDGSVSEQQCSEAKSKWWHYIKSDVGIRNFATQEALLARIALFLLISKNKQIDNRGEDLEWFLEFVNLIQLRTDYEIDLRWANQFALEYFDFGEASEVAP